MLAIKGGTVLTGTGAVIENATIIVEGEMIKAVGKNLAVPDSCTVVEASGCYITPGFIDAHCHVGLEEEIYRIEGDDLNETTDPVQPHLRAVDGINFTDLGFQDALEAGVTRVLVLPGSANIIGGQAALLSTKAHRISDMVLRDSWGVKAALGENPKRVYGQQNKAPKTRMGSAALLREALFSAARLAQKENREPKEEFRLEPLIKVLRREIPLLLHVHRVDDILTALRIKDEFDIDMVLQHGTEAFMVADAIAERQVAVCLGPLLTNRAKVELKEVAFRNALLLHKAGVRFCLITDHPVVPIQFLPLCAALAVREGLDEEAALRSITIEPARILRCDAEVGSIEPGKKADLVLFDGHPFELRSKVVGVMVRGIWGKEGG